MATLKSRILVIVGLIVVGVTLRKWRQRRAGTESIEHGHKDVETAAEHAAAASEHARLAAKKAVKRED